MLHYLMESTQSGIIQWSCSGLRIWLVWKFAVGIDIVQLNPCFKVGFVGIKDIFYPIMDPWGNVLDLSMTYPVLGGISSQRCDVGRVLTSGSRSRTAREARVSSRCASSRDMWYCEMSLLDVASRSDIKNSFTEKCEN
jgi:hypothetical protein